MANTTIQVFRTSVAGRQPNTTVGTNSQYINAGGLALNMTDQILYTSDGTNLIIVGANSPSYSVSAGNVAINSGGVFVANATGFVNASTFSVGTSFTANSTLVNAAAINVVNQTNTATLFVTTSANIASSNVIANTSGVFVQNTSGVMNSAVVRVTANLSLTSTANLTLASGTKIIDSTGSQGTTGQVLASNGSGNVYWTTTSGSFSNGTAYTWTATQTFNSNVVLTSGNATNQLLISTINATSVGLLANSTVLTIGNNSVNTTVTATSFSGTANNANNLNGQAASYYTNASNITTGTLPFAQIPGLKMGGQQVITSNTTLGSTHFGGDLLVTGAAGTTITLPASGAASGQVISLKISVALT